MFAYNNVFRFTKTFQRTYVQSLTTWGGRGGFSLTMCILGLMSGQVWELVPLPTDPRQGLVPGFFCVVYVCIYLDMYEGQRTACWFPSFRHVSHGNWTQIFGVGGKYLCLLSSLSLVRLRPGLTDHSNVPWDLRLQMSYFWVQARADLTCYLWCCIFLTLDLWLFACADSGLLPLFICSFRSAGDWSQALPSPLLLSCSPPAFSQWFAIVRFWLRQQGLAVS